MIKIINDTKNKDMNKGIYGLLFVITALLFSNVSVSGQQVDLIDLLNKQDFPTIHNLLDEEIDLCVMDDTQINSRDEAISRMKNFLQKNPITSYDTLHKGKSDEFGSKYNVYKVITNDQKVRAFVYFEIVDGKTLVKEIRFDKF